MCTLFGTSPVDALANVFVGKRHVRYLYVPVILSFVDGRRENLGHGVIHALYTTVANVVIIACRDFPHI